ncbi:MAG: UvrB/UvrC motif-containing protein [Planctomycetota bacterium]
MPEGAPDNPACEHCSKPKTVHVTEIKAGQKIEKHLCKDCPFVNEGVGAGAGGKSHQPINELLSNFVLAHSGAGASTAQKKCEVCGMTWAKFKQGGLLGCENDYSLFEEQLTPLLKRAHEGSTHHTGKVPTRRRGDGAVRKRPNMNRLRRELTRAVEAEDYEAAARLRDQIAETEGN